GTSLTKLTEGRSGSEALKQIAEGLEKLLSEKQTSENAARLMKAQALLGGRDLKQLISGELARQWKMDAGDISSKEDVQSFYNRLRSQTKAIAESVHRTTGDDNMLFRQVENIRQNVDFMDQLNKAASYVQLPLHLSGEDAHGDLYVYTDKKSLAQNSGKISAFLHLDMDTMGPVDVYVAMEHEKVSTNFYLRDDEMIDFISENIHILDERLADLGYDAGIKVSLKEKGKSSNVMDEIMEDHRDGFLIGTNSFDIRA
ncbi:MAG: flagellar hook-length control protein FliK, partial [Lachnospiraceae bacterium]|nr:flagellar hook-length control protein FliK [Lachnospiraceae bacterium]